MEQVSMVNNRGRIVYVDSKDIKGAIEQGMRLFPDPKEEYYPEYDESYTRSQEQPPLPSEIGIEKLEVRVI